MRVSVVVPVYNGADSIGACLQSLRQQIELPDEIIIVDNESTDDTPGIVQKERQLFKGIQLIVESVNKKGCSVVRNKGVAASTGDIIAFTDSDCIPRKDWVKNIKKIFEKEPELGIVGGIDAPYSGNISLSGKFLLGFWEVIPRSSLMAETRSPEDFFDRKCVVGFNFAVRRDVFGKIGGFDENFRIGDDADFGIRAIKNDIKIIVWNPDMVVCHRQNISVKQLAIKQFFYGKEYSYILCKHFRNRFIIQFPLFGLKEFGRLPGDVFVSARILKLSSLVVILIAVSMASVTAGIILFLAGFIYHSIYAKDLIQRKGGELSFIEIVSINFILVIREMSFQSGKIYGSWCHKVFCV